MDALLYCFSGVNGVLLLAALMFAERFVIILPSYAVLALAGAAAAHGLLDPWWALGASLLGSLLAAWCWHVLGLHLGGSRCRDYVCSHGRWMGLNPKRYDNLCSALDRNAGWTLLLSQIVPTIRILATLPAGVAAISWRRILLPVALGSLLWNAFWFVDGYVLGVHHMASPWQLILVAFGVLSFEVLMLVLAWWLAKRRASRMAQDGSGLAP